MNITIPHIQVSSPASVSSDIHTKFNFHSSSFCSSHYCLSTIDTAMSGSRRDRVSSLRACPTLRRPNASDSQPNEANTEMKGHFPRFLHPPCDNSPDLKNMPRKLSGSPCWSPVRSSGMYTPFQSKTWVSPGISAFSKPMCKKVTVTVWADRYRHPKQSRIVYRIKTSNLESVFV